MDFNLNRMLDPDDESFYDASLHKDELIDMEPNIDDRSIEAETEMDNEIDNKEDNNESYEKEEFKKMEGFLDEKVKEEAEKEVGNLKKEEKGETAVEYSAKIFDELLNIYKKRKEKRK